ncbi:MAG: ribosome maturation factor RimM [Gammaproteobacteria bacterium]|nr:ribosome maturation factor RimM [Gammaproteobacteria bacterium]
MDDFVVVGQVSRPFGLKGWSHITSFTEPAANILSYRPWALRDEIESESVAEWNEVVNLQTKSQMDGFLARIEACKSRTDASRITGKLIGVPKESLPAPKKDQFYWFDLIGTKVFNLSGTLLGCVDEIFDSGAHSILRIKADKKEIMIPFVSKTVREIRQGEQILVDWESDW